MNVDPNSLPEKLVRTITGHNPERGAAWLRELPDRLDRLAARWSLALQPHYPELSYHYVAPAVRTDGTQCVLKVGPPRGEVRQEIEALRLFDGDGMVRLLESNLDEGALLLERLEPGVMLAKLSRQDDDAATRLGAEIMRRLWRPAPAGHSLRTLESWFGCFARLPAAGTTWPSPLFERGAQMARELIASTPSEMVLHGDLHHFNILSAQREPYLAIDPKGLAGDPAFDLWAFLRNPDPLPASGLLRRLDILTEELNLDRPRVRAWLFASSVLNACWSLEDGNDRWRENLEHAKQFDAL